MNEPAAAPNDSRRRNIVFITVAALVLISGAIVIGYIAFHKPRGVDVDLILKSNGLTPAQKELETVLAATYHEYRTNSSWWSLAYYGCVFVSALLSAMSALILKLVCFPTREEVKKDVAALCATVAALLITLSTVGNFQQKWQANRLAATAVQNLVYEVWKSDPPDRADISTRMGQINLLRNQEIVGGITAKPGETQPSPTNVTKGSGTPGKTVSADTANAGATNTTKTPPTENAPSEPPKPK